MNIQELQQEVHAIAVEKGWHDKPLCACPAWRDSGDSGECTPPEAPDHDRVLAKLCLVHSELSEAEGEAANGCFDVYYNQLKPDKPEGWIIEIADALIRVLDTCGALGLDPASAIDGRRFNSRTSLHAHVSAAVEAARVGDYTNGFVCALSDLWQACEVNANLRQLDLHAAIKLKIAYNRTRPHRHGGKLA